jgi:hypothetical protein
LLQLECPFQNILTSIHFILGCAFTLQVFEAQQDADKSTVRAVLPNKVFAVAVKIIVKAAEDAPEETAINYVKVFACFEEVTTVVTTTPEATTTTTTTRRVTPTTTTSTTVQTTTLPPATTAGACLLLFYCCEFDFY